MFGVLSHVSTFSALVLNLAKNAAQFGAHFGAQYFLMSIEFSERP